MVILAVKRRAVETDGDWSKATFDNHQISADRLSSVQYIKFQLTPAQAARFTREAMIVAGHSKYRTELNPLRNNCVSWLSTLKSNFWSAAARCRFFTR